MIEESRKLKRGLRDVSALFVDEARPPAPAEPKRAALLPKPQRPTQCWTLIRAGESGGRELTRRHFRLAQKLGRVGMPAARLSVISSGLSPNKGMISPPEESARITPRCMAPEDFEKLSGPGQILEMFSEHPVIVILDFSLEREELVYKAAAVLDKCVLVVGPSMESLSESYRFIKMASRINRALEYHVLFEGILGEEKGGLFFERFSEIVSKHLGVRLEWLGTLQPGQDIDTLPQISFDSLTEDLWAHPHPRLVSSGEPEAPEPELFVKPFSS